MARGITLREALELHLRAKPHAERTETDYRDVTARYLADWLDRPLREIGEDRRGVRERHERVSANHGASVADRAVRVLRACYNRALREFPELPTNPCANVDYHGTRRRQVDLSAKRLRDWGASVLGLPSPVRRDFHLFTLLTGMRRTAASEAKVEHVDLSTGVLHVPLPKGGADRAFDLPLSGPLRDLIRNRIAENPAIVRDSPWLFPSPTSKTGRVAESKERALCGLHGHALRHAYASLALEAGVPMAELKLLLNHAVADVTFGYLRPGVSHLRACQERASARALEAVGLVCSEGEWPPVLAAVADL